MPLRYNTFATLPFWFACLVLLSLTVWVSWYINARNQDLTETIAADVDRFHNATELTLSIRELRTQLNRFLVTRDSSYLEAVASIQAQIDEWLKKCEATSRTPRGVELLQRTREGFSEFQRRFPTIRELPLDERWNAVNELRESLFNDVIVESSREYLQEKQSLAQASIDANGRFASQLSVALLGLGICGAGLGVVVGYLMSAAARKAMFQLSLPVHDAAGKLEQIVGPIIVRSATNLDDFRDNLALVAEQVGQVVERLHQSRRETLRAEQLAAVGQMAAGMAHELRNPLTSIKILVQAANDRRSLGPRDLLVLEQEVSRLEELIKSFLDFARPPQAEKRRLDLRDVVQNTTDLFRPRAERLGAKFDLNLPSSPVWVSADATQLHQLLLNLLGNALDAIDRGGQIRVELIHETADGSSNGEVVLRVEDDGCGLPQELGPRIFDPFVSTKQTGVGMGLSICRRIVEDHRGSITAMSRAPRGAVLSVRLPLAEIVVLAA